MLNKYRHGMTSCYANGNRENQKGRKVLEMRHERAAYQMAGRDRAVPGPVWSLVMWVI